MILKEKTTQINFKSYALDIFIYLSILFLVREINVFGHLGSVILGSIMALIVANWRMKKRDVSWKDLGLRKPENIKKQLWVGVSIIVAVLVMAIMTKVLKNYFPDVFPTNENTDNKFAYLKGNLLLFFSIIFFIWIESMLEELIDRGFLMNWLEGLLFNSSFKIGLAITIQAVLFGFRHSYDLSEISITTGLIGLFMGIGYYASGRNLWVLIIVHCILNTYSIGYLTFLK
ncbi:CPBP family intramembrane glutamic endopeptidase [Flavivirga rizhaonensis]|uniref:CPBP family intramembrane metalloprotease n=1 Tax=Flavivirga rizhaonensis TaxID=2559571 RepID=A0A4S1DS03_9FLAO|nr:CPBP family intramembrane glutamic endopeptidase [Flavivirga rizhaonensis]TGV00711.1 CPBP family intramembrane metalloprotease [Flavivirga rizhaonensis]